MKTATDAYMYCVPIGQNGRHTGAIISPDGKILAEAEDDSHDSVLKAMRKNTKTLKSIEWVNPIDSVGLHEAVSNTNPEFISKFERLIRTLTKNADPLL